MYPPVNMSSITDVAIEIAAPTSAAAVAPAAGVVQTMAREQDEVYSSCCGPAPIVSRAIARIRFAVAALVIVITSIYYGSPKSDPPYTVPILADNLLHAAVVYFLCRGSFGERRRALLAYCLLEVLFIVRVLFTIWHTYGIDESFALIILLVTPAFLYVYFYRALIPYPHQIFIRHYYFLLDRERQSKPIQEIIEESIGSSIDDDFSTANAVKKRNP